MASVEMNLQVWNLYWNAEGNWVKYMFIRIVGYTASSLDIVLNRKII